MKSISYEITADLIRGLYWDAACSLSLNINNAKIFRSHFKEHKQINTVRDVLVQQILTEIQNQLYTQLKQGILFNKGRWRI